MSIKYPIVAKRPRHLLDQAPQYYPILKGSATQSTNQISKNIIKRCSSHPADVQAALIAMRLEIGQSLESGMLVQLEQLGSFSLSARAKGTAAPRQVLEFIMK